MGSSVEVFEFQANTAGFMAETYRMQAQVKILEQQISAASKASAEGNRAAALAAQMLVRELEAVNASIGKRQTVVRQASEAEKQERAKEKAAFDQYMAYEEQKRADALAKRINAAKAGAEAERDAMIAAKTGIAGGPTDANAVKMAEQVVRLGQVNEQLEAVRARVRALQSAASEGHAGATVALAKELQQLKALNAEKGKLQAATAGVTGGFNRFGGVIGQVSYAVDDFVTVLQMPGMGLIPALRASANNLSVVLGSINPMLVVLPSLATLALGAGMKLFGMAENTKELEARMKASNDEMQRQADHLKAVGLEAKTAAKSLKEYLDMQGETLDARELAELNPLKQKEAEARKAMVGAEKRVKDRETAAERGVLFEYVFSESLTDMKVKASKAKQELEAVQREIAEKQEEFTVERKGVIGKLAKGDATSMMRPIEKGVRDRLKKAVEGGATASEASRDVFSSMASDMEFGGVRPEIAEAMKANVREMAAGAESDFFGSEDSRLSKAERDARKKRREQLDFPVNRAAAAIKDLTIRRHERELEFMESGGKIDKSERKRLDKEFDEPLRKLTLERERAEIERTKELDRMEAAASMMADAAESIADAMGGGGMGRGRTVLRNPND